MLRDVSRTSNGYARLIQGGLMGSVGLQRLVAATELISNLETVSPAIVQSTIKNSCVNCLLEMSTKKSHPQQNHCPCIVFCKLFCKTEGKKLKV